MKQPKKREHSLQVQVLTYLESNAADDVFAFAIPNAGKRSGRAGAMMKREGMMRGVADICVMLPEGRTGWLEMKAEGGRLSDWQLGFAARCQRLGHWHHVSFTLADAIARLEFWGALRF
jgi:hypothetical protein